MTMLPALRKLPTLAAILAGAALLLLTPRDSVAEPAARNGSAQQEPTVTYVPRTTGTGGYSMTLRDIWGPAKMPPAPKDFGPHYDYPPQSLNGVPIHDPYPN